MPGDPFQIDTLPEAPLSRAAFFVARPLLERVLALSTYRRLYRQAQQRPDAPFESRALRALDISARVCTSDLDHVPRSGPVIVAANHPHGVVDGLVLLSALRRVRPDIRVLTNQLLARIPELRECCLFVDPFDGPGAAARSRAGLRAAHLWLRRGGALIVFPAGEVAHERASFTGRADSAWKPAMSRLALATGAPVIPAFIAGGNSQTFYAAGRVHPWLRTLLLPRELLKKRGAAIAVRLGEPIASPHQSTAAVGFSRSIRAAVDGLGGRVRPQPDAAGKAAPAAADEDALQVASGFSRSDPIAAEIAALPSACCLVDSGPFRVFCVRAGQIPLALREIGTLRAIAFRAVGEGSDSTLDLDRFDARYLHLFAWDTNRQQIVGAYRIGQTDRIVSEAGVSGLYTRTLFRYDERLIQRMPAAALELGRSFVRAEYQKNYHALLLLWKGIGRFIARHPEYRLLFGPVSISARYSETSHQLLMAFLHRNRFAAELGELVTALHTPRFDVAAAAAAIPQAVDDLNALVERAETDGKGMPVLLRQYLKLNARLVGFNVDPAFGHALDALMVVDLTTVDLPLLHRYLGRLDASRFLAYHDANRRTFAAA